jgi:hypothetical protein
MRMSNKRVIPEGKRSGFEMLLFCVLLLIATVSKSQETRSSGWVVIPVSEYRALHAKAYPADQEPEASPVQATLTRVDYDLQIRGDVARGRVSLTVDVLKDGWVRVPIPSGLLVREAKLDNKLVSLAPASGKGSGQLTAVLSHSGRSVLLLDIALPIGSNAGSESIVLPAADSGITRASIQLLRHGLDVQVTGGLLSEQSDTADESKWVAYGRGNEPLTFSWRRKAEDHRTTQALRLRGSLIELVSLGEDSTSVYAEVNLEVVQGAAAEVRIQLPEKVTVNQVLGASVADVGGAHVTVTNSTTGFAESTVTDAAGRWVVSNFPTGIARIRMEAKGFRSTEIAINYDATRGADYPTTLSVGETSQTVEVQASSIQVNAESANLAVNGRNYLEMQQLEANAKKQEQNAASANVMNLQRRVAGVLPVAIEVPRTGTSFQFVRPLVLDEETKVTFSYRSK